MHCPGAWVLTPVASDDPASMTETGDKPRLSRESGFSIVPNMVQWAGATAVKYAIACQRKVE